MATGLGRSPPLRALPLRVPGTRRGRAEVVGRAKTGERSFRKGGALEAIGQGRTPTKASVDKYDRSVILEAWLEYVQDKAELSNRAKRFHLLLTGRKWVPVCTCV